MSLEVGQPAPDFALSDTANNEVKLSDFRGKPVVLFFFPKAFTGTCERQISTTHADIGRYQALGAQVLGVSTDHSPSQAAFIKGCGVDSYPVLSDFRHRVVNAYGVAVPEGRLPNQRATFIIDGDGVVQWAHVEANPGQWVGTDEIVKALEGVVKHKK